MKNRQTWGLVTGSSSGLGKAIAIRLAQDGYSILIHYNKDKAGAEDTLNRIKDGGGEGHLIQFDVSKSASIEEALDAFFFPTESLSTPTQITEKPVLSVLVNNAGIHQDGLLGLMSDDAFDQVLQTNLYGPFYLMRWCIRKMIRQRHGSIVNISSLAGQVGNPGQINYSASKAGLIAMTKTLSMEVGSRGIRVNAVAPGFIETGMLDQVPQLEEMKKRIPLRRLGLPNEVAGAVSFLCSSDASYITGHTLSVNGGLFPS